MDWPFKLEDSPLIVFPSSQLYNSAAGYLNDPDFWLRESIQDSPFQAHIFKEVEVQQLCRFCAVNGEPLEFSEILGALTSYNTQDCKYLFMVLYVSIFLITMN